MMRIKKRIQKRKITHLKIKDAIIALETTKTNVLATKISVNVISATITLVVIRLRRLSVKSILMPHLIKKQERKRSNKAMLTRAIIAGISKTERSVTTLISAGITAKTKMQTKQQRIKTEILKRHQQGSKEAKKRHQSVKHETIIPEIMHAITLVIMIVEHVISKTTIKSRVNHATNLAMHVSHKRINLR